VQSEQQAIIEATQSRMMMALNRNQIFQPVVTPPVLTETTTGGKAHVVTESEVQDAV